MLYAKFGWNWPSGSGEEDENVKSLQTDGQTDNRRQVIREAHLSWKLKWAKKGDKDCLITLSSWECLHYYHIFGLKTGTVLCSICVIKFTKQSFDYQNIIIITSVLLILSGPTKILFGQVNIIFVTYSKGQVGKKVNVEPSLHHDIN